MSSLTLHPPGNGVNGTNEKRSTDQTSFNDNRQPMSDPERGYAVVPGSDLELQHLRSYTSAPSSNVTANNDAPPREDTPEGLVYRAGDLYEEAITRQHIFWQRLRGVGKRKVGWVQSGKNAIFSTCTSSITRSVLLLTS